MVLDHLLPSIQPQFFLEWTRTSFEQSLAEFYTILLEEHPVALEMLAVRICSSLWSPKLTRMVQCSNLLIVLAKEDVEVHFPALQTMTEQFQLCEWGHCRLGKLRRSEMMSGSWDAPDCPTYPRTSCSNSTMRDNDGTSRINTILLPKPSQNLPHVSLLESGIPDCGLP
jgi:hypothetical protein